MWKEKEQRTGTDQGGYVAVARHPSPRNLANGGVDGVKKDLGFFRARHFRPGLDELEPGG